MLHSEFFLKRMSKSGPRPSGADQIKQGSRKLSLDGRRPKQEFEACRSGYGKSLYA